LLQLVNASYKQYERDRSLVERAMELSSEEFVTKHKELAETSKQLSLSNEELEKFAYVVAHDLKEPLRSIGSFTQLLERRLGSHLDEDTKEFMGFIQKNVRHMQQLLNDTITFSKIKINPDELELVDTNQLLREIIDNYNHLPLIDRPILRIKNELPHLRINLTQIRQVWQNLMVNAIKYNKAPIPEIIVSSQPNEGFVQFSIQDNGIGIDPGFAKKVFDLFTTLHNKLETSSSGIGLAVCKKNIEKKRRYNMGRYKRKGWNLYSFYYA